MKRNCILYKSSESYNRHICLDVEFAEEILNYVEQNETYQKKFDYILGRLMEQRFMYYEDYHKMIGYQDITEMRFFPNGDNGRIYCKEVTFKGGTLLVVVIKVLEKKKSGNVNKAIKQIIKPLLSYEYELI